MALGATLKVKMDTTAVGRGLVKIRGAFSKLQGAIGKLKGAWGKMKGGKMGAIFGVVKDQLMVTARMMAVLRDEMERTGASSHDLLAIRNALVQVGVDADTAADMLGEMQKRLAETILRGGAAEEALKILDLDVRDLDPLAAAAQFEAIMKAAKNSQRPIQDVVLALDEIFGGEGIRAVGLARHWDERMKTARENTKGLAKAIDDAGGESIRKMQNAATKFNNTIRAAWVKLLGVIDLEKMAKSIEDLLSSIPQFITLLSQFFAVDLFGNEGFFKKTLPEWFGGLGDWFMEKVVAKAKEVGEQIGEGFVDIITTMFPGLKDLLGGGGPGPGAAIFGAPPAIAGKERLNLDRELLAQAEDQSRVLHLIERNKAIYRS